MSVDHLGWKFDRKRNHSSYSTGWRRLPGRRDLRGINVECLFHSSMLSMRTIKWCRTRRSKHCAVNCRSPKRKSIGRRSPLTRSAPNLRMLNTIAECYLELTFHLGDSSVGFFFFSHLLCFICSYQTNALNKTVDDWFDVLSCSTILLLVLLLLLRGLSFKCFLLNLHASFCLSLWWLKWEKREKGKSTNTHSRTILILSDSTVDFLLWLFQRNYDQRGKPWSSVVQHLLG